LDALPCQPVPGIRALPDQKALAHLVAGFIEQQADGPINGRINDF
jgi:hypothetical protein